MDKNLSRRDFLGLMGTSVAAMTLTGPAGWGGTDKKPNFILIFADDLGYGDISGFGLKKSPFETPNLERMAAEGAKLTNFYVPTPYCAPSRATILTGRYPFRNGVVFNPSPDARHRILSPVRLSVQKVPHLLPPPQSFSRTADESARLPFWFFVFSGLLPAFHNVNL